MNPFECHPTPWTRKDKPDMDYFFVRDASGKTVVMISAVDETSTEQLNDQGGVVRTIVKTPRPGAEKLADMIVALPRLMTAIADAHAALIVPPDADNVVLAARLESLIEKLA